MTDQQHPITPPQELVEQWIQQYGNSEDPRWQTYEQDIATRAARWGADQELEACVAWLAFPEDKEKLRADRRPKPPSLKEQALEALNSFEGFTGSLDEVDIIRRALEAFDD